MNSRSLRSAPSPAPTSPDLLWRHEGVRHRVTVWPEVAFQSEVSPGRWREVEMTEALLESAVLGVGAARWRRYLEYVPPAPRAFLLRFAYSRMAALAVIVHCPGLFDALVETPALTPFLASHLGLRGGRQPAWAEMAAVHEREGVFGVLQWLGLPASRQTLAVLRNIADPDLPRRLLEPLRSALWEPEILWSLQHAPALTDEQLVRACHALAA